MNDPTFRDLIEVADVDTVVRLDGPGGRLAELVLTGDVVDSLATVLRAAGSSAGAGFFVVGPFGSGKSHFLAAVGELLTDPGADLAGWGSKLRQLAVAARRSLPVRVPLVEYRARAALEDVVSERAWQALGQPGPDNGADRLKTWDTFLHAATTSGHAGVVILLDELSEFLRAKQGPALTEDLRFLQFLGEWARERPALVLGALQENIEEVATVSQRELARIRDRYPVSLTLSMRHVEDLVRGRLVRMRPDAEPWVARAWEEISAAFPGCGVSQERFAQCYPLHPDTLTVLEGLRFLLSQTRGVVDFICRRVGESLERPYVSLITPDEIFDHFRERLRERTETTRYADTVVPYFERTAREIVDADDVSLALRTVKLLCLLAASPLERARGTAELAFMVLVRVSDLDPSANVAYLEHAILEPLVTGGTYLVAKEGTYTVELAADAALVARTRVAQARAELSPGDRRLVRTLVELGSTPALPFQLASELGMTRREFLWQNTLRSLFVGTTRVLELTPDEVTDLVGRARRAGAEGCLLISEVEVVEASEARRRAAVLAGGTDRLAVWVPDALKADERDALLDLHSRRLVLEEARGEGRSDLVQVLERNVEADAAPARELLRRLYAEGTVVYSGEGSSSGPDLPSLAGMPFERSLGPLADPLLGRLHPRHREVMPRGELVGDRIVRQLFTDVLAAGRLGPATVAQGQLRPLIEGFCVPLGLVRLRRDGATVAPDAARSPAVAETLRLVGEEDPVPGVEVMHGLADGPVGLTQPEALLVLNACVQAGLLEAWRGRNRMSEPFTAVAANDRFGAGELIEPSVRGTVAALSPITGPGPFEPWTAGVQRSAWEYAKAWLQKSQEDLGQVQSGLARFEDVPALGGAEPGPVLDDMALVSSVMEACSPAAGQKLGPLAGLRALVAAVPDGQAAAVAARRLASVARFLRDELRRVEESAAYLTHPELGIPDSETPLRSLRDSAVELLRDTLRLASEDRAGDFFAASREFRSAYLSTYQHAHDRYYEAVSPAELEKIRATPAYQALAALSTIGAIGVPDDRVRVDRALAAAAPAPCRRRVDVELAWKPQCTCRFALGDREPSLDRETILSMIDRGVREYLEELARPDIQARLDDAASDLAALGRVELQEDLRRLAAIAHEAPVDTGAVASLVGGPLVGVLRDVLTGGQLIVTRDLSTLREDVIGRRYPKRKLLEIIASWVDPAGDMPVQSFVEVVDSSESLPGAPGSPDRPAGSSGTVSVLAVRVPGVAALLPTQQAADAFWLAAWWRDRPSPPAWLPTGLLSDPERLAGAAEAVSRDPAALAELADLDGRVTEESLLGGQVAAALDLAARPAAEVAGILKGERLLRHPAQLAAGEMLRRIAGDWQLVGLLDDIEHVATRHALLDEAEWAALLHLVDAARQLAELERGSPAQSCQVLVEELYPVHYAPVRSLMSRASVAAGGGSLVSHETLDLFCRSAGRLLRAVDAEFASHAGDGFAGCLRVWEVGDAVVGPLLSAHGRVAVLLVDAMRADLSNRVVDMIGQVMHSRSVRRRWAVVPAPTRTAESVAALHLGRPVPGGSALAPGSPRAPFAHLGYDAEVVLGADRDQMARELRRWWASGPPISIAVATAVDERLHRTSVELTGLLDEASTGLGRRVIPSLSAIPDAVPLVVLADHGFRENPNWGQGPEGRYVHGGTTLEECVVPVVVFEAV
jgi:hypothetical protein